MPARNCIDLIPGRVRWLLAALPAFATACGEDVTPIVPTTPAPEPRVCTDELERPRAYINSILPREWDGTPFRFDLVDHFPEIAGRDYLDGQLGCGSGPPVAGPTSAWRDPAASPATTSPTVHRPSSRSGAWR